MILNINKNLNINKFEIIKTIPIVDKR
jgi:hypothetical protein